MTKLRKTHYVDCVGRKVDESIHHVVSGCSKLVQGEYRRRYDNLGKRVHWKLARKCNFEA